MTEPRHAHTLRELYARQGTDADMSLDEALVLGRDLMASDAYREHKHPDHAKVVRDCNFLYELAHINHED
jgi:hypothetical protein